MASCCSSSVSLQRSAKSERSEDQRSKSCDTVCTSNSSCFLQRRKPPNPLMYSLRPSYTKTSNTVRQRVLSAKLQKLRSIQSQLNDANYHLSELTKENQILKNLQKRQDKALSKYENTNADLPRLLHSHEEQLRVMTEKNKAQRKIIKELNDQLKLKEDELMRTQDRLTHLEKLSSDKRLLEREKMADQLEDLKIQYQKAQDTIGVLNRKLMLEGKTSKQRLNAEMMKHKESQRELMKALGEVDRLSSLLETKESTVHPRKPRFSHLNPKQSISMVTLGSYQSGRSISKDRLSTIEDDEPKSPVTDVRLEPINCRTEESLKKSNGILYMPSESIRNRLSSGSSRRSRGSQDSSASANEKDGSSGSEVSLNSNENLTECKLDNEKPVLEKNRICSADRLNKIEDTLDAAMLKAAQNAEDEFEDKLGDYCVSVISNVRQCSERIEMHKKSLDMSKEDTNGIFEKFNKTRKIESKLKSSLLNLNDDENLHFLNGILNDEISFQDMFQKDKKDNNGNVTHKEQVKMKDKQKLLATLKAIDGESIDKVVNSTKQDSHLLKEIYNDISQ